MEQAIGSVTTMYEHNTSGSLKAGFDVEIFLNAASSSDAIAPTFLIETVHNTLRFLNCLVPANVKVRIVKNYISPVVHNSFSC
jgi:hypothetical protein